MVPTVTIVGRPNVGKSSLFNLLARRRISIVEPTPGVTRDRLSIIVEEDDLCFELIDTGGIVFSELEGLAEEIQRQIEISIQLADLILFVIDIKEGVHPLDREIAGRLRKLKKPVVLIANKADTEMREFDSAEALSLGFGEPVPTSTTHFRGREEVLGAIASRLPSADERPLEPALKLAIVGRRNVGKSTFLNSLLQEERVIVSSVAGTTRDCIDVRFKWHNSDILLIDTAGLRKKRQIDSPVEFFSLVRAQRAVRRADVAILMLEATQRVSRVDKQLSSYIKELYKPVVIAINKWDLAVETPPEKFDEYLSHELPSLRFAPIVCISALTGFNIHGVLDTAIGLHDQSKKRVPTSRLNRILEKAWEERRPRPIKSRTARFYYATQVGISPPTILLFVNDATLFPDDYRRFLLSRLQETTPFREIPIRLKFIGHSEHPSRKPE